MNLWLGLLMGLKEIWAHKFRSFLTMLGVILGVASLLSMFSLTAGMARGFRDFMTQVGGLEMVSVINQEAPPSQDYIAEISPGRTIHDAEAIKTARGLINYVSPILDIPGNLVAGSENFTTEVKGAWPDYIPINNHVVEFGRPLTWLDVEQSHHVCVVGSAVVEDLWFGRPHNECVGEKILINQRPFTIVGVFQLYEREEDKRRRELGLKPVTFGNRKPPGATGGGGRFGPLGRKNSAVVIPISTAFYEFRSTSTSSSGSTDSSSNSASTTPTPATTVAPVDTGPNRKLDGLVIQIANTERFKQTIERLGEILRVTHRGIEDFGFDTREEWFDRTEESVRSVRASGGLIAGISLIVGGIGITNIMLASITERIREIGVRRAVGAKGRDIFMQIVVESAVIGFIGGILGLFASFGIMRILVAISPAENAPVLEWQNVVISFSFAVVIGILSGLYPAFKASHIEPIEALRYG